MNLYLCIGWRRPIEDESQIPKSWDPIEEDTDEIVYNWRWEEKKLSPVS